MAQIDRTSHCASGALVAAFKRHGILITRADALELLFVVVDLQHAFDIIERRADYGLEISFRDVLTGGERATAVIARRRGE